MATIRTFGRMPTLGEMKEYYERDDALSFLYDECRMRNVDIAFRKKRWPINPTSKAHLREIIRETIESKIERAYRDFAGPIDSIRLEKFDYLSFHSHTSITSDEKLMGFDIIFEADMQGWRRAFEDLCGVIKLLDDFGVCYRMKYSGVRSLHFMIPFEAFPRQFNGKSVLSRRTGIQGKIQDYFRRYCGMKRAHGGSIMRLAYSLNEDNGLVSLPISSDELSSFRPWEANIHNVIVDKPWHGDIPSGASRNMLEFLREVYNADAKARERKSMSRGVLQYAPTGLEIVPKDRSGYAAKSVEYSVEKWAAQLLRAHEEVDRVEAAWNLMTMPETVPISVLKEGLDDENADVRWFLTETLQKRLDADAIRLAGKMLRDGDQFVRISAIDAFALAGENALSAVWDSMASDVSESSIGSFSDVMYAVNKIGIEDKSTVITSFIEAGGSRAIASSLEKTVASGQPGWRVCRYVRQVRELCKRHDVGDSVVFSETIRLLVPKLLRGCSEGTATPHLYVSTLQEIRKNEAVALMTIREIANSLGIDPVKIPENRMTEAEREFLQSIVKNALTDMSPKQKARILVLFMLHGKLRLMEPSTKVLLRIGIPEAVETMAQASTQKSAPSDRLVSVVSLLRQIEPSIGRSPSADKTLDQIGGNAAMPALIEALRDEDRRVRRSAVRALGRIGNLAAVPALIEAFGDRTTRNLAISALGLIGQPAVPPLIKALRKDKSITRRATTALALGRIGDPTVVPVLIEALKDKYVPVRANAVKALGAIGGTPAISALIEALSDKSAPVRATAAKALGIIGDSAAVPALIKALTDETQVRAHAARALGAIGDSATVPALTEVLADEHWWLRRWAGEALRNIGTPEAIEAAEELGL